MKRKVIAFLSATLLIIALLSGCDYYFISDEIVQYTFLQDYANVEKVEICTCTWYDSEFDDPNGTITAVYELSEEETASLWADIQKLPAGYTIPTHFLGDILFVICYRNGEKELIGFADSAVIRADNSINFRGISFWDGHELARVFAKYMDAEKLAKLSKEYAVFFNQLDEA